MCVPQAKTRWCVAGHEPFDVTTGALLLLIALLLLLARRNSTKSTPPVSQVQGWHLRFDLPYCSLGGRGLGGDAAAVPGFACRVNHVHVHYIMHMRTTLLTYHF